MCTQQEPHLSSLVMQLRQLNERSRMYSGQAWLIPFSYLGIVGVLLSILVATGSPHTIAAGLFGAAAVGVFVFWLGLCLNDGVARAVAEIRRVECKLHLERTAEDRTPIFPPAQPGRSFLQRLRAIRESYVAAWLGMLAFTIAALVIAGIYILCTGSADTPGG